MSILPRSRLGFGTSGIMGAALSTSGRLRLLEAAFEQGIRHFDTAPLYGQGEAETVLGKFGHSKRDSITITTKFGLIARPIPVFLRPAIPLARAVNRRLVMPCRQRFAGRPFQGRQGAPSAAVANDDQTDFHTIGLETVGSVPNAAVPPVEYSLRSLRDQVETSLRKLKTDYIDYYLLHECQATFLNQSFLEALNNLIQEGKIRHYGIGAGRWQTRCILDQYPEQFWVIQIPDSLNDCDTNWFSERSSLPLFTHSALRLSLENREGQAQSALNRWADITGQNLDHPGLLGEMLLHIALTKNATGCVIFSSRHAERIRANAELLLTSSAYRPAAEELLRTITTPSSTVTSA